MKYFIGVFLLVFPVCIFCQELLKGHVVRISDGDTITLLDSTNTQNRIRLYGIDCPENGQEFANVARRFTSDLVYGKKVKVVIKDIDRYGRKVGVVMVNDTVNVNLELLRAGLAWHYKYFDNTEEFAFAELTARENKIGLWGHKGAIAPWEFRRNN